MEDDEKVLDEIFGPGAPKSGGPQQTPSAPAPAAGASPATVQQPAPPASSTAQKTAVKKVAVKRQAPPTSPAPSQQPTVKKVAVKKPAAGQKTAGGDPSAGAPAYSPYTSGYGAQQFPLGMKEMGDDSLLQSGIRAFDEKRFEEALNYFKIVLVSDRSNAQAKFFLQKTRERLGLEAEEKKKKKKEEKPMMSREEALGTKLVRPSPSPPPRSTGSAGVYRVPTSDLGAHKHEYARTSVGIDTGLDRTRIAIIIVMISMGLAAAAYLSLTM